MDGCARRLHAALRLWLLRCDTAYAPAHHYPAAIDDGHDAWMWLLRKANTFDIDPARIAIGGQSAGGGPASALVQRACDGGAPYAVAKSLICPTLDKGTAARRDLDAEKHVV